MVAREALRQAITDLERLTDQEEIVSVQPTTTVLARLYTTFAQATLEAHGISIDLPALCGDLREDGGGDAAWFLRRS